MIGDWNVKPMAVEKPISIHRTSIGNWILVTDFPLSGTRISLMPTLINVFEASFEGRYLINLKSNRQKTALLLQLFLRRKTFMRRCLGFMVATNQPIRHLGKSQSLKGLIADHLKAA